MKLFNQPDPQKQEVSRKRHFSFRLNVFFFCMFLIFSVLIVRLAILQFVEGPSLAISEEKKETRRTPIPPIRGDIFDRTGYKIAYSTSAQSLYFRLETGQNPDQIIALARRLEDVFAKYGNPPADNKKLTAAAILKSMDTGYDLNKAKVSTVNYAFTPRRIKTDLTNKEIAYIMEHGDLFPSTDIVEESVRNYDKSGVAVQLVGYLKKFKAARATDNGLDFYINIYDNMKKMTDTSEQYLDNEDVGYDGLEFMYQEELRGKNGEKSYPVNVYDKIVGPMTITPPLRGRDLYLTIDKEVQLTTEAAIMNQIDNVMKNPASGKYAYQPNVRAGYAVALEVKTGRVIAMASMPDYDPGVWRAPMTTESFNKLQYYINNGTIRNATPNFPDDELKYHPTSIVPLGSTMKPLSVLLGLNEGLITPYSTYNDTGTMYFGKDKSASLTNSDKRGYGTLDPEGAIAHSSNTFMAEKIGNALYMDKGKAGLQIWDKYMKEFGLGAPTGSGLPNENNGIIEYFKEAESGSAQSALIYASFGQQGRYTTLQLAQYTATLANRGKRMKPQFVEAIKENGVTVKSFTPEVMNEVTIPDAYWDVVEKGMIRVNKQGFDDFPYTLVSKTGTSQQDVASGKIDNAVFIAYAPAENPVLAVAVIVPEGGFGSWGAAPIARKIFDAYDKEYGLDGVPKKNSPAGGTQDSPADTE